MAVNPKRITRPCVSCGAPRGCRWNIDAWVCGSCGDEWYPEHGEPYQAPETPDTPSDVLGARDSWDGVPDAEASLV